MERGSIRSRRMDIKMEIALTKVAWGKRIALAKIAWGERQLSGVAQALFGLLR